MAERSRPDPANPLGKNRIDPLREAMAYAPETPGVYRMYGRNGVLLYVGKAKSLRQRLRSYLDPVRSGIKTRRMLEQVVEIDFTVTPTEVDALLLESNLIKHARPRYNIVLRDDKSYPYIRIDDSLGFPRLVFHRGRHSADGRLLGPYPDAGTVRKTLLDLQKLFHFRNCSDLFFRNRERPCLQHQIGRCSAPCVGRISEADYRRDFNDALEVLEGRGRALVDRLYVRMQECAEALDYEGASAFRDLITRLRQVREQDSIVTDTGDVDVILAESRKGLHGVGVTRIREGKNLGTWCFFPVVEDLVETGDLLAGFLIQFYEEEIPAHILLEIAFELDEARVLETALEKRSGHPVRLGGPRTHAAQLWTEMTRQNLKMALDRRVAGHVLLQERFQALSERLESSEPIQRIVGFDVSHTLGEETVASCVVFEPTGPVKADYRRFVIRARTAGDDYAALDEAITRYFKRLVRESGPWPDVVLIDGGIGQWRVAEQRLSGLGVPNLTVLAIAKGPERRVGAERILRQGGQPAERWEAHDPAFHLLQQIRDESHRFAIGGHRRRRTAKGMRSSLAGIPGLGPKRRGLLLAAFGGLSSLEAASESEIARVPGIGSPLAHRIFLHFHAVPNHEIT
jgi:excinuclease ABC subunit C